MRHARVLVALAGLLLAAVVPAAHADNSTCTGAVLLVPDGSSFTGETGTSPVKWFRFVARANRSYAVMLENLTVTSADGITPDQQPELAIGDAVATCGGAPLNVWDTLDFWEPVSISCQGQPSLCGAARQSLQSAVDGDVFFGVWNTLLGHPASAQFRVRVEETTLFSSFWTTASGFRTVYRIYNTTNLGCSVTLRLRTDGDAAPAGGSGTVTFNLAGNHSVSRHTGPGDLNLAAGQQGHATITHNCTPGAIQVDGYLALGNVKMLPVGFTAARQQRERDLRGQVVRPPIRQNACTT